MATMRHEDSRTSETNNDGDLGTMGVSDVSHSNGNQLEQCLKACCKKKGNCLGKISIKFSEYLISETSFNRTRRYLLVVFPDPAGCTDHSKAHDSHSLQQVGLHRVGVSCGTCLPLPDRHHDQQVLLRRSCHSSLECSRQIHSRRSSSSSCPTDESAGFTRTCLCTTENGGCEAEYHLYSGRCASHTNKTNYDHSFFFVFHH